MLFSDQREEIRQTYVEVWRKQNDGEALTALESQIVGVIRMHPEYQPMLENGQIDHEATADQSNPFLHMGLHLAILEQVQIDRPAGIRDIYQKLRIHHGDAHTAEHGMMMCLEQALWTAQQNKQQPDQTQYLENLRRLL